MTEEREARNGKRDDVGTLLRLAGKREPVPQDRSDRVRAAARDEWRRQSSARRRSRTIRAAAGLLAAASVVTLAVLWLLSRGTGVPTSLAATIRVEALSGPAQVREVTADSRSIFRRAAIGDEIVAGSELTTQHGGRAAILLASGHSMRLDSSTRVRWRGRDAFVLERGAVYVDSGADAGLRRHVEIDTPFGGVHDLGTQFEVRLTGDAIRLSLREGSVVVHEKDGGVHNVSAGTELVIAADGTATERSISPSGPEWDWAVAIAPMPELEGRSARAFLEWMARERGWTLAFSDESLESSSERIVLDGSFEHLPLDQLLDAVLPTCRMTYRVEQGILTVSSDSDDLQ